MHYRLDLMLVMHLSFSRRSRFGWRIYSVSAAWGICTAKTNTMIQTYPYLSPGMLKTCTVVHSKTFQNERWAQAFKVSCQCKWVRGNPHDVVVDREVAGPNPACRTIYDEVFLALSKHKTWLWCVS